MTELLTAAQMKAIEAAAIATGEVTGLELMERAGRGVVEAVFKKWPELAKTNHHAVVLCGPGGNGGDGFVVARLLQQWGWEVEVFLHGDPGRMPADTRVNYERWLAMGTVGDCTIRDIAAVLFSCADQRAKSAARSPVVIDALFGIGLTRPITGDLARIVELLADMTTYDHGKVVAVDIASGLCADSGRVLGRAVVAALTVTFHRAKCGHYLQSGPDQSRKLALKEIGLLTGAEGVDLVSARTDVATKHSGKNKYSHGHAFILSGPPGHCGAGRLAAGGALRIGAGLVTVACPPEAVPENAARLDAVMLRAVKDGAGLLKVLADIRINALCIGPGLGLDARAVGLVAAALGSVGNLPTTRAQDGQIAHPTRPAVLDADALTILSQYPDLFAALHPKCVLTPHAGEFARLFPDIAAKLDAPATKGPAYSKVDATRQAAARAGCVVLFKGADTVIADPSGRCSINSAQYDRSAPWLATAGSGDVLAGFITGLLARGFAPLKAAETAAWLHVECARSFGPGLIAEDLADELPKVFRTLGM